MHRGWRLAIAGFIAVLALVSGTIVAGANGASSLKGRMLSISDMPSGWSVTHYSGRSSAPAPCGLSVFHKATKGGQRRTASFVDGSTTAFEEGLATGRGELRRWRALAHRLSTCHQPTTTDNGKPARLTIGAMSLPTISRTTHAFAMTFTITGINLGADVVLFRAATYEGFILYGTVGSPTVKTVASFTKAAVRKAEGKPVHVRDDSVIATG